MDSGADHSVISENLRRSMKTPMFSENNTVLRTASGKLIEALGKCTLQIKVDKIRQPFEFLVFKHCSHDLILGWDFFKATDAVIDCGNEEILINEAENYEDKPTQKEKLQLRVISDCIIPAKTIHKISVSCVNELEGKVLVNATKGVELEKNINIPASVVEVSKGYTDIWVTNWSNQSQFIPVGMTLAELVEIEDCNLCSLDDTGRNLNTKDANEVIISEENLIKLVDKNLKCEEKNVIVKMLKEFYEIFDFEDKHVKVTTKVKHKINTGDAAPIKQKPYRVSIFERKIIQNEVDKMLKLGIIESSESPWSAPVVLVKKHNGDWRFCVDYRKLNKVTKKDVYPLPRIDDAIDNLSGASMFSAIDLKSGYWQIEVDEKDREKTAFITPDGLYQFKVMPFGLCNAPATFERMMDNILKGFSWKICLCYLDDIIVYGSSFEEHLNRLRTVLQCIKEAGLTLNHQKCIFGQSKLKILGHLIDKSGVRPDPEKVEAIKNFPLPKNISNIRSFLGICSYYRRFIKNFANLAAPLQHLLKKDVKFAWNKEQDDAFAKLKSILMSDLVLGYFRPKAETLIHCDASGYGLGAVLVQIQYNREIPIAYASRSLLPNEKNYSTTEKECLAVIWAINKFRPYLFGQPFTVVTDHHSLCWLANLKDPSGRLARWALRLQEYDIKIIYKSGKKHQDADCLSRNPLAEFDEKPEEIPFLDTLGNFKDEQIKDQKLALIREKLSKHQECKNFHLQDEILYKKNFDPFGKKWLLVIPRHLRIDILQNNHDAPTAGHLGFTKTYDRIRKKYYWPGMYRSIRQYIAHCRECQRRKAPRQLPAGHLQPIQPSGIPFTKVGVDLLGRFPLSSEGNRYVIVCTDYLTRFTITKALPNGEAIEIAKFLIEDVILKHGAPRELISDRGRSFLSNLIFEINRLCKTTHLLTSAYHPQTNGLTERFNKTLADMLAMYVSVDQRNWDSILPFVTFAYNSAKQESTGFTPFFLMHGREVETPLDSILPVNTENSANNYVAKLISNAEEARQLAKLNIMKSQSRDKYRYDQHHRPVEYHRGDLVWIYTPVRKVGLSEKLLKRYFGPYQVIEKLSDVTYRIAPCEESKNKRKIKEVVHVIRMKPYHDPDLQIKMLEDKNNESDPEKNKKVPLKPPIVKFEVRRKTKKIKEKKQTPTPDSYTGPITRSKSRLIQRDVVS